MTTPTKTRPERVATDVSKTKSSPGAKTGGSGDDKPAASGKSKKLKLAIVLLVVLLAGGAIAKFTVLAPPAKSGAHKVAKPVKGPVVALDDMTLNLTDGSYLRLKVTLQLTKGTSEELDTSEASQVIIDTYSNRTVDQLTGVANRNKVKKVLVSKLEAAYPKQIMDVYYTEFVTTS